MKTVADLGPGNIAEFVSACGLSFVLVDPAATIPGSFWGNPEAGLIKSALYAATSTPVHSVLHEAAHYICMPPSRRRLLHTDAGGDDIEETAVCGVQLRLATALPDYGLRELLADMDQWGYSFREGSAAAWLNGDAKYANRWLEVNAISDYPGASNDLSTQQATL